MVSIAAFQAVDPGSIPGRRILFFVLLNNNFDLKKSWSQYLSNRQHFVFLMLETKIVTFHYVSLQSCM